MPLSNERKLIEAAASGFSNFENMSQAKIIAFAIALGGTTLKLFTKMLADGANKNVLVVRKQLAYLLQQNLGFD